MRRLVEGIKKFPALYRLLLRIWALGSSLYPRHLGVPETNIPKILEFARSLEQRKKYLDIGGGHAPYHSSIQPLFENSYCLDIISHSNGMINITGDAHYLPIKDNCINLVTAFEVLEHLQRPWLAFKEIARVLRPGGFFAATAPMYWHIHGWPSDYWRFTSDGLKFLAQDAGLATVLVRPMAGPAILWSMVAVNNFGLNNDPFRRIFGATLTWICHLIDKIMFPDPMRMRNPDTRGWLYIASKP